MVVVEFTAEEGGGGKVQHRDCNATISEVKRARRVRNIRRTQKFNGAQK